MFSLKDSVLIILANRLIWSKRHLVIFTEVYIGSWKTFSIRNKLTHFDLIQFSFQYIFNIIFMFLSIFIIHFFDSFFSGHFSDQLVFNVWAQQRNAPGHNEGVGGVVSEFQFFFFFFFFWAKHIINLNLRPLPFLFLPTHCHWTTRRSFDKYKTTFKNIYYILSCFWKNILKCFW